MKYSNKDLNDISLWWNSAIREAMRFSDGGRTGKKIDDFNKMSREANSSRGSKQDFKTWECRAVDEIIASEERESE